MISKQDGGIGKTMKILIIEDDIGLSRGISYALDQEGYETVTAFGQKSGIECYRKEKPDGVILDLNLPDGDGIDICRNIRQESDVPILMLTARDMEIDEIMGLKSGADDYITKPFSISILKIRLENALRKYKAVFDDKGRSKFLTSGNIRLDTKCFKGYRADTELDLSMTELRLLKYFLENKNQVLLKEQILQHIWDEEGNFVEENTLSVNISRLRKKLECDSIKTIHGMGYLWEER